MEMRSKEMKAWLVVTTMSLRLKTTLRAKTIKAAALVRITMKIEKEIVERGVSWTKMAYTKLRN